MLGFLSLVGYGWWFGTSGQFALLVQRVSDSFYAWTAEDFGFRVAHVYLEGRDKTPLAEVEAVMGVREGMPILQVSLDEVKGRLESLGWVREAVVDRSLPHTLHVQVFERQGVALWQHEGVLRLVDRDGVVIPDAVIADYSHLPVVVGEDAPSHTYALLGFLSDEPELFSRVSAAIRVGGRRWNVRLYSGIEIKLPEEKPGKCVDVVSAVARGRCDTASRYCQCGFALAGAHVYWFDTGGGDAACGGCKKGRGDA